MKQRLLTSIICLLSVWCAMHGQVNPKPGYIVGQLNDTIYGTIDFRTTARNAHVCVFKAAADSVFKEYTPQDIYAYRFTDDGKYYVSRQVNISGMPERLFLECLIGGIVNLYYYATDYSSYYFLEDEEGEMYIADIPNDYFRGLEQDPEAKRRILRPIVKAFRKSPATLQKLWEIPIRKQKLCELTKAYHNEVCSTGEQCIQYEYDKDEQAVNLTWMFSAGVFFGTLGLDSGADNYHTVDDMTGAVVPMLSVGLDLAFPRLDPSLSLQAVLSGGYLHMNRKGKMYYDVAPKPDVKVDMALLDVALGPAYRFELRGKRWKPGIKAGVMGSSLLGIDYTTSDGSPITSLDGYKDSYHLIVGFYAGAMLEYQLGKGSLTLDVTYKNREVNFIRLNGVEVILGYRF